MKRTYEVAWTVSGLSYVEVDLADFPEGILDGAEGSPRREFALLDEYTHGDLSGEAVEYFDEWGLIVIDQVEYDLSDERDD